MNIAIDARILNGRYRSGMPVYTEHLITELAKLDTNNNYQLLLAGLRSKPQDIRFPSSENFRCYVLPVPDRQFWNKELLWNEVVLPLHFTARRTQVFHAPAFHHLPGWRGVKRIITIHDLRSLHLADDIMPQNLNGIRRATQRADLIISVSEFTRQDIIKHFSVPEQRVRTIHCGVDDCFQRVSDVASLDAFREQKGLTQPFFLTLGLAPRKNIAGILEAYHGFSKQEDIQLVLAGYYGGEWCERYQETVAAYGLTDRVHFFGPPTPEELVLLMNAAFAFLFPSLWEGFGIPVLEAMRCGTPVIASDTSSLPEVCGDAALLVDPHTPESITAAMETLSDDEALRQELIQRGERNARKYSWRRMAREVLDAYQSLS
jgi:glycosyltransferase involved in cell wall biosynthesis